MKPRTILLLLLILASATATPFISAQAQTQPNISSLAVQGVPEVTYLVVPFEFEDLPATRSIKELRSITIDAVQSYYDEVSYGKIRVVGEIVSKWIKLPYSVKNRKLFEWNFDSNDMWKIDSKAIELMNQLTTGPQSTRFVVYAGEVWGHARPSIQTTFVNEFSASSTYAHELGHVLGLPDLYSYIAAQQGKYSGANVGPWDLMSTSSRLVHFCSWSKLKLEWISSEQTVEGKRQGIYAVDAIENRTGKTLVVRIRLNEVQTYYVEVREYLGAYATIGTRAGILIIFVDGRLDPKEGGLKVIDAHPNSYGGTRELFDAPFSVGIDEMPSMIDKGNDLSVIVLKKISYSYKIVVSDVAMGEKAIEANNIIKSGETAIARAKGELRLKGLDEAQNQLFKAKETYSQALFTEAIKAAKLAVELATSATHVPIVVSTTVVSTIVVTTRAETTTAIQPTNATFPIVAALVAIVAAIATLAIFRSRRKKVLPQSHTCTHCNTTMKPEDLFCVNCGKKRV
jgi:hypothetical protein